MFVRVTTTQAKPDKADETVRVIKEVVLPAVKGMAGFEGGVWLFDRAGGKGLAVTFFESEAAMRASEIAAQRVRTTSVDRIGASLVSVEHYEVIATAGAADSLA